MRMNPSARLNLRLQNFVTGLLATLIIALLAYASHRYSVQWDWTANQRHTLAEQSIKAIKSFTDGVTATVYVQENKPQQTQAMDLLERYRQANPGLTIRTVDPDIDPAAARKEEVAMYGTVVLRSGSKTEKVTELSEEAVTNGLIRLAKGARKGIYFISGHGEHPVPEKERATKDRRGYGEAAKLLAGEGYTVSSINLATEEKVPENATVLVVAGPRKALLPIELQRLEAWYKQSGRLLVLADPYTTTGLEELLGGYGLSFSGGLIIDPVARIVGGSPTSPLVNQYDPDHPITKGMNMASIFPEAQGVDLSERSPDAQAVRTRLFSGADKGGWLRTQPITGNSVAFEPENDRKGPILIGAAVESGKNRLVAIGDADFPSDTYLGMSGNLELFLNIMRWLAEDEDFIAITPKQSMDSSLTISMETGYLLFLLLVVIIPLLLIVCGVAVWMVRKRR